jgi:hypothetical protein
MQKILFSIITLIGFVTIVSAQPDLMLSQQTDLWHANGAVNPAFFPKDKRIAIGGPGFSADVHLDGQNGLTFDDFVREVDGRDLIDLGQAIPKLKDQTTIALRQRIETVSGGVRVGRNIFSASHAIRVRSSVLFPKELPQLLWSGNAQFIGQTVNIGPTLAAYNWHEIGLGWAREFGKFTLGARAKWMVASNMVYTDLDFPFATVYTNPDVYQLQLRTDYGFLATDVIEGIDTSGFGYELATGDFGSNFNVKNSTLGLDLGATWRPTERLMIHASMLDIGTGLVFRDLSYYRSSGTFNYDGVTLPGANIINGDDLNFETRLDSLNDIFQFKRNDVDRHRVRLPARMYVGANFNVTKKIAVGATAYHEQGPDLESLTAAGASVQWAPLRWVSVTAMYSVNNRSATNLGGSVLFRVAGFSTFIASDNLLNGFSQKSSPAFNLRAGLNFAL